MRFHSQIRRARNDSGYIMMTLLLTLALMIIFAAAIVPSITFDIKRDREEEMIHRGVQYSRAIRAYYKKFNRYPMKIEDLENTNQMRFLRRRYKDPETGKDFKLLHFGEAKMSSNAMGGGMIPVASTLGPSGSLNAPGGLNGPGGMNGPGMSPTSGYGNNSGFGSSSFGQSQQQPPPQTTSGQGAGTDPSQQGSGQPGTPSSTDGSTTGPTGPGNPSGNSGDKLSNTTFGGAPIVGVASTSKEKTIREFDKKKKYDEWQFVYDPTFDRGFLITTPYQPSLQQFGMQGTTNLNGQNGQNGTTGGFGNNLGNSPGGMQNNPNSPTSGFGNQNQPSPPPQQSPQSPQ